MKMRLGEQTHEVERATLELYHLEGTEADWNLEVYAGNGKRVLLCSGIAPNPVLPGPTPMQLQFVDDPDVLQIDGQDGAFTSSPDRGQLVVREVDGRVRVEGRVPLWWNPFESGAQRTLDLGLDVTVELNERRST